jgi:hypothetical protein
VTGRYFASSKPKRSSKPSYDKSTAARLWQVSADLVGLTATRAPIADHYTCTHDAGGNTATT